jgi:hypothetical protein
MAPVGPLDVPGRSKSTSTSAAHIWLTDVGGMRVTAVVV